MHILKCLSQIHSLLVIIILYIVIFFFLHFYVFFFFFYNDPATTEIYPLPLPAALPILRPTNPASSPSSAPGFFDEAEKNTDSRTSGASSASEPAPLVLLSKLVSVWPASWRMGTSTPDRKSTRLNSSHGYISYAVFCLKQ